MTKGQRTTSASTSAQPGSVTQRMNQGISQHKAIAMQGIPEPARRAK